MAIASGYFTTRLLGRKAGIRPRKWGRFGDPLGRIFAMADLWDRIDTAEFTLRRES